MKKKKNIPSLEDLPKDDLGFKVPANYFARLQDEVMGQIHAETVRPSLFRHWLQQWFQPRLVLGLASLAVLILAVIFLFRPEPDRNTLALTYDEVHQYVNENLDDFELELLLEYAQQDGSGLGGIIDTESEQREVQEYLEEILDEIELDDLEEML